MSIHFSAEPDTIDTIYRIILSVNQLSIYGAVAAICDEYEGQPDNTGEPVILEGQSIVLREVKAEAPAREEPEDSNVLLQKYFQQVKQLSPENRLGKFCKEAGFTSVVEVGQYLVTRNASEFLLKSVACREYTLPRDGQGDGVPKACLEQAAADSRGSRTCVCASTFGSGVTHAGGGRMN